MAKRIIYNATTKETVVEEFEPEEYIPTAEEQIEVLKNNLLNSDYKAIKYAEGFITEEDYAPIKAQRQAWRDEINRLEGEIVESEN